MAIPKPAFLSDLIDAVMLRDRRSAARPTSSDLKAALARPAYDRLVAACAVLMGRIGDASGVAVADQALKAYGELDPIEKVKFFRHLRGDYGVDTDAVRRAYAAWDADPTAGTVPALFAAVEPRRQTLLRRLNMAPGATLQLVGMRADLLAAIRKEPDLAPVDIDFSHLLGSWFNRGFLEMRRIDWGSPASVLEKIIAYETVHPMAGWSDIRRRLEANDRRIYAFFHPATGNEPLIFVEVALVKGIPDNIAGILGAPSAEAPSHGDTAVFYSINNALAGLKGVSFGNFLIKQVVADLTSQLPQLRTFVTLSPAPGFATWLGRQEGAAEKALAARLAARTWMEDAAEADELRPEVLQTAARYFIEARDGKGRPVDPVARFHLGNGASAWQVNWPADRGPNGLSNAHGLMINYLYEPALIEAQHEAFVRDGIVAHGPQLTAALKK